MDDREQHPILQPETLGGGGSVADLRNSSDLATPDFLLHPPPEKKTLRSTMTTTDTRMTMTGFTLHAITIYLPTATSSTTTAHRVAFLVVANNDNMMLARE